MELGLGINNSAVSEAEKAEVLASSDNTCQFCGFKSDKFQEVIKVEGKAVCACSFCYQTLDLYSCAKRRAGYLAYIPELTQAELNHLLRAIYVARTDSNPEIASKARGSFDALTARRKVADEILGTDEPKILGDIIYSFMSEAEVGELNKKLSGIRLLSLDKKIEIEEGMEFNEFPQMLNFWKNNVEFLNQPCASWQKLEVKTKDEASTEDENVSEEVNEEPDDKKEEVDA